MRLSKKRNCGLLRGLRLSNLLHEIPTKKHALRLGSSKHFLQKFIRNFWQDKGSAGFTLLVKNVSHKPPCIMQFLRIKALSKLLLSATIAEKAEPIASKAALRQVWVARKC